MAEEQAQKQEQQKQDNSGQSAEGKTFTQADIDRVVQDRLARERQKYADYDELVKFKTEYEKQQESRTQQELEAQKEYEKLKESWSQREKEYQSKLTEREQAINNMTITNALTSEVMKNSAYPDAVNLVKEKAVLDDGVVKIKGKDANGMESLLPIEDGVKQFLQEKPYLVRSEARTGAGTGPANSPGSNNQPRDLVREYYDAQKSGDRQKQVEIKKMIRAKHSNNVGGIMV